MADSNQTQNNTSNQQSNQNDSSDENSQEDVENQIIEEQQEEDEEDVEEWTAHKGKIMQIVPYKIFDNINWDKDYSDPTGTGNVSIPYSTDENSSCFSSKDLKYIYQGVSCKVKIRRSCDEQFKATGIEETGLTEEEIFEREHIPTKEQKDELEEAESEEQENLDNEEESEEESTEESEEEILYSRSSSDDGIYGFISEVSYNQDGVEIEIKDYGHLLERDDLKLSFNALHSIVFEEVIKSYGLIPDVDFTGLPNELINWTNITNDSDSTNTTTGGESEDINQLASEICQGITDPLEKAKAIHQWCITNITYPSPGYSCSHYSSASECLQNKDHLNCADTSRLTRALMSAAGLDATVVHGPNHFWTVVTIDGTEYASDATSHQRAFNEVWKGLTYYDKNGDNPSC